MSFPRIVWLTPSQIRPNGNELFLLRTEGQIEEPKEVKTIDIYQFGSWLFCLTCLPAKMLEQTDYTCRNSL